MSEDKSKSRKWLIFLGVAVLVAVVVTIVILALPPDVNKINYALNNSANTMFLTNSDEKGQYDKYEKKMSTMVYKDELADIKTLTLSIDYVLDFYNQNIIFSSLSDAYRNNFNTIKSNLENLSSIKEKLNYIIQIGLELDDNSSTFLRNSMIDFRISYSKWLSSASKAINALQVVFNDKEASKGVYHNDASKYILIATSNYLEIISKEFDALVRQDTDDSDVLNYSYKSGGKISYFFNIVNKYLKNLNTSDISTYNFIEGTKIKYDNIKEFEVLYGVTLYDVISSIELTTITFVPDPNVNDANLTSTSVINFIKGA